MLWHVRYIIDPLNATLSGFADTHLLGESMSQVVDGSSDGLAAISFDNWEFPQHLLDVGMFLTNFLSLDPGDI